MRVEQKVGKVTIHAYTDGYPTWPRIEVEGESEGLREIRLTDLDDLKDLHYAVGRFIEKLTPRLLA